MKYKLCYINRDFAYFTNKFIYSNEEDLQWGDDWDDVPYFIKAGVSIEEFHDFIVQNGGSVYYKKDKKG